MLRNASIIAPSRRQVTQATERSTKSTVGRHRRKTPPLLVRLLSKSRSRYDDDPLKKSRRKANVNMIGKTSKCQLKIYDQRIKRLTMRIGNPMEKKMIIKYIRKCLKDMLPEEKEESLAQVRILLGFFEKADTLAVVYQKFEDMETNQEVKFVSRLANLLYYEIYGHVLLTFGQTQKSLRFLKNCEYFSRTLKFDSYTLEICFKIADVYKLCQQFKSCTVYLENALQLAVKLKEKYQQMKALDKLGMCYYYKGNATVAHFYHSKVDDLDDITNRQVFLGYLQNTERSIQMYQPSELQENSLREPYYFGLKRAMEIHYDQLNKQNAEKGNRELIRFPVFHRTLCKMKEFMNKEDQIGKIKRYGKFRLERVARTFIGQNTDFLNQVVVTHRNRKKPDGKHWVYTTLGREFQQYLDQLFYIEGILVES